MQASPATASWRSSARLLRSRTHLDGLWGRLYPSLQRMKVAAPEVEAKHDVRPQLRSALIPVRRWSEVEGGADAQVTVLGDTMNFASRGKLLWRSSANGSVNRFRSGAGIQMISKHVRNTSAMLSSPRCGARTRSGNRAGLPR